MRYLYWFCCGAAGLVLLGLGALYARPAHARPAVAPAARVDRPLDTPTATPTGGGCGVSFSGSTPRCQGNTYTAYFGFYNSCPLTFTAATTLVLQVGTTFSGPWTDFDSYSYTQQFPPGASSALHDFSESSIPGQYIAFRVHYMSQVSNGQQLDIYSQAVALCNQGTVAPTPTGYTLECYVASRGHQAACTPPGTYSYDFGVYIGCGIPIPGSGSAYFEVATDPGGPWTTYDQRTFSGTYPPGAYSFRGTFTEPPIPAPAAWYRIGFTALFAGNHNVADQTDPAPLCGPPAATITPTAPPPTTPSVTVTSTCGGFNLPCTATPTVTPLSPSRTVTPPGATATPSTDTPTPMVSNTPIAPPPTTPSVTVTSTCGGFNLPCTATPTRTSTVVTTPTATPTTLCASVPFNDVQETDYFYVPVGYLYCRGVISGYGDGTFRPYTPTTRAQMVKIVVLGFALPVQTPFAGAYTFADVPPAQPFFDAIETAAAHAVVGGYTCGGPGEPCDGQHRSYFRPNANVTRGQLSKITVQAAAWAPINPPNATFADVPPASPFYTFVETAACHGLVSGYGCGGPDEPCDAQRRPYFRQYNNATRGQIAKIVYGALTGRGACGVAD